MFNCHFAQQIPNLSTAQEKSMASRSRLAPPDPDPPILPLDRQTLERVPVRDLLSQF